MQLLFRLVLTALLILLFSSALNLSFKGVNSGDDALWWAGVVTGLVFILLAGDGLRLIWKNWKGFEGLR